MELVGIGSRVSLFITTLRMKIMKLQNETFEIENLELDPQCEPVVFENNSDELVVGSFGSFPLIAIMKVEKSEYQIRQLFLLIEGLGVCRFGPALHYPGDNHIGFLFKASVIVEQDFPSYSLKPIKLTSQLDNPWFGLFCRDIFPDNYESSESMRGDLKSQFCMIGDNCAVGELDHGAICQIDTDHQGLVSLRALVDQNDRVVDITAFFRHVNAS